eukprot:scaffold106157_cov60-Phaeocystis_antarctica.AAC.3
MLSRELGQPESSSLLIKRASGVGRPHETGALSSTCGDTLALLWHCCSLCIDGRASSHCCAIAEVVSFLHIRQGALTLDRARVAPCWHVAIHLAKRHAKHNFYTPNACKVPAAYSTFARGATDKTPDEESAPPLSPRT